MKSLLVKLLDGKWLLYVNDYNNKPIKAKLYELGKPSPIEVASFVNSVKFFN